MNASVIPSIDLSIILPDKTDQVCEQVGLGFPVKTVAWMFGLSPRTVEQFVRIGKARTGCRSNVELAIYYACRELGAKLVMVDGKRKIIALAFVMLFALSELSPLSELRTRRSRRGKDEYEFLCDDFDLTEPLSAPII